MNINLKKIDINNIGFFRFKELNGEYLLTNELGDFIFLNKEKFKRFIEGKLDKNSSIYKELSKKNFINTSLDRKEVIKRYRYRYGFLWQGSSLHIVVVTLRCNQRCIYCQSSSVSPSAKGYDMSITVAKKVVDRIFTSPSPAITIEFQGGEPLINWKTTKYIISYALKKNKKYNKDLRISLVSNFNFLDEDKLDFLINNRVSLCTSLDGPEKIHNKNRPEMILGKNSYRNTINWIKKIKRRYKDNITLNALVTISKYSLRYPEAIIDEYIKWGFWEIHLRPLSYLGISKINRKKIGYKSEEFINFYKKALDYLIHLNLKGKTNMSERTARVFLTKILTDKDPGYLDIRSPCGAGIGQVTYNYDGKIFCCDEARMIGEDIFCIGDIRRNWEEGLHYKVLGAVIQASTLEGLYCDYCVYKPYCGVCPVCNYAFSGSIFSQVYNDRCKINKSILDYLFLRLKDKRIKSIFNNWIK